MNKKHKKICTTLNRIEQLSILASAVTGCVLVSALASLLSFPIGITYTAVGLKIYKITVEVENHKSIIRKKRKKHDKIVLLANFELNPI